ncbi:efflux RND transporter periplasmic adaptor subunit [Paraburkholderia rhizosphaerae]|uniref:Multidrug efflux system membrane fusion protein n=1 Tax=Paraburkholderia rhizosphaerae TaxID=480658 RepID=A0A4R8LKS5_9BURK|nr:efflux RND transporter periplasmic adaptor subunit [Paraburkholderia rhizosphaerae]TDY42982.1 multidrug efflux system membrane fusion protein [Paraburkholderia rhizosphaerae]
MLKNSKRMIWAFSALILIGGAVGLVAWRNGAGPVSSAAAADHAAPPAVEVDVATVISRPIIDWQDYSGRLEAIDAVEIKPLVPGTIVAVHFKDGALVRKGDPLFTIDPRPYVAEVDRASAQLAMAVAHEKYTDADAARADRLLPDNAIAKRDYDETQSRAREAIAQVKAAQAALEAAKVNLDYTHITAPVSGRMSRALLTVGNVVAPGANAPVLSTLVSVSPIYAAFDVDEHTYLDYLNRDSGKPVPVSLELANETSYSRQGAIYFVDNHLDTSSGTIRVRARFDNADGSLVPGLYARVQVGGGERHPAILIDDAAIGTDQAKKFVLVVDHTNHVQYREIVQGNLHEGLRVVTSGLKTGDRIVVNGIEHARPGDLIKAHDVDMATAAHASGPAA